MQTAYSALHGFVDSLLRLQIRSLGCSSCSSLSCPSLKRPVSVGLVLDHTFPLSGRTPFRFDYPAVVVAEVLLVEVPVLYQYYQYYMRHLEKSISNTSQQEQEQQQQQQQQLLNS